MTGYWEQRNKEKQYMESLFKRDAEYNRTLQEIYLRAQSEIEKEIQAELARYAGREQLSIVDAREKISKMDVEAFQTKAKKYVKEKDFSPRANDELRAYNVKMRMNRLRLLYENIRLELIALADEEERKLKERLDQEAYEEIIRQAGILGQSIPDLNLLIRKTKAIAQADFKGAHYSDRVWKSMFDMQRDLEKVIEQVLIQGRHPNEASRILKKHVREAFENKRYASERISITESARVQSSSQKLAFEEFGVQKYEFIAETDSKTCSICGGLDGKTFEVKDMAPGENAAPMHPNCRCSVAAKSSRKELNDRAEAMDMEPGITTDMLSIEKTLDAYLGGLEYRLKSVGSLKRKVNDRPYDKMRDVVRYTFVGTPDNLVTEYFKAIDKLENKGYTISKVKNTWIDPKSPYKGINTNVYSPEGYEFEIQYHTKESFDLKNGELHELYEKQRKIKDKNSPKYLEIDDQMFKLSKRLLVPNNIRSVE
ncbi:minor capsid protein [Allofustis seminis]|uniref:minor capsid protein n=1 Tax=Allofustis seminis TaxID=166939 RepID=UPI00035E2EF3|nr:minor capsid protein [Allofustis seminis]